MKQLIQNTHTTACILSVAALLLGGCSQDEALPGGKTEAEVNTRVTGDDVPVTITPPLRPPPPLTSSPVGSKTGSSLAAYFFLCSVPAF